MSAISPRKFERDSPKKIHNDAYNYSKSTLCLYPALGNKFGDDPLPSASHKKQQLRDLASSKSLLIQKKPTMFASLSIERSTRDSSIVVLKLLMRNIDHTFTKRLQRKTVRLQRNSMNLNRKKKKKLKLSISIQPMYTRNMFKCSAIQRELKMMKQ